MGLAAILIFACAPNQRRSSIGGSPKSQKKDQEIRTEQRTLIAHEFFLRARQQEMAGNDAVALSYYQIAYEYDTTSRDLCFLLADKLKSAGKLDSSLTIGLRCLDHKGQPDSHEFQALAEMYLRKGDIKNALGFYNKAVKLNDEDKDLLYTLATIYESLKDIPKHVAIMEKLLPMVDFPERLVEKQVQNFRALGKVDAIANLYRSAWEKTGTTLYGEKLASFFEDQELYSSMLGVARTLSQENPDNIQYEVQKARAMVLAGQPDSALLAYEGLIKKNPAEREFLFPYASLLFEKGRFAEAKIIFQKLVKEQPDNAVYHFFLGSIGMELKEQGLAESELKAAIHLDGKVPEYWAKLAATYIEAGQEEKALELIAKMGEAKDWYGCYIQGIVFTQVARKLEVGRKGLHKAIKAVDTVHATRAQSIIDTSVAVHTVEVSDSGLGRSKQYREKGVDCFRKALTFDGKNRRVLFELGVALEQLSKKTESIEVMKKLIKIDSSDGTILNYLGYMLVEENMDLAYAGTLIDRALWMDPNNGAFLDSKGWYCFQKKDFPQARKFIERALDRIPQDTTILEHYALILEQLGLAEEASEQWRLILKLDPNHEMAHRKLN